MNSIYIGQIMQWAGNWVPEGFFPCNGAELQIRQYPALAALLSNRWGGDGVNTFKLPNLQGKTIAGYGANTHMPALQLGQYYTGEPTVALTLATMPIHTHSVAVNATNAVKANAVVSTQNGTNANPTGLIPAAGFSPDPDGVTVDLYKPQSGATVISLPAAVSINVTTSVSSFTITNTGGSVAHKNMQPYLSMYYVIAWQGIFPDFQ